MARGARTVHGRARQGQLPKPLFLELEQGLLRRRIVLPARSTLERLVVSVSAQAFAQVESSLAEASKQRLDGLLESATGRSPLFSFRASAPEARPDTIGAFIAYPSVESAVDAMKLGADDYPAKPFVPDDLLRASRLLAERRLRDENELLERHLEREYGLEEILGVSPAMQAVFETARRVAEVEADVLIIGETGTGKELVARSIHKRSARKSGRFVPVDCGAIPEDLLESEFFGHERGAFTGAHARSLGLLEFAHRGSFFLDEIGELSLRLQVKLLRVLQERKIRRVGGREEIPVDVRVIAATSRKLADEIKQGRFREDLFYRVNVARIELPPLRERAEDVPLLVEHFVARHAAEMGRQVTGVDPDVLDVLSRYGWPGNVRELLNVVKRALAMCRQATLTLEDLPAEVVVAAGEKADPENFGFFHTREQRISAFEREYLANLLRTSGGDVSQAAREARIPRGTFYRLLKKHDIDPATFRTHGGSAGGTE